MAIHLRCSSGHHFVSSYGSAALPGLHLVCSQASRLLDRSASARCIPPGRVSRSIAARCSSSTAVRSTEAAIAAAAAAAAAATADGSCSGQPAAAAAADGLVDDPSSSYERLGLFLNWVVDNGTWLHAPPRTCTVPAPSPSCHSSACVPATACPGVEGIGLDDSKVVLAEMEGGERGLFVQQVGGRGPHHSPKPGEGSGTCCREP